jgi:hypothetical protein
MFIKRSQFEETPAEELAEIAYEIQINQIHDIKWRRNRKIYYIEKDKRRDFLDASSSYFLTADTWFVICFIILFLPSDEF